LTIKLNGENYIVENKINLKDFLDQRLKDTDKIVVEHNYSLVNKEKWGKIALNDGDIVEVLRFVGGG